MKTRIHLVKLFFLPLFVSCISPFNSAHAQTARVAMEVYKTGPVWQIMTFKAPPGRVEVSLRNTSKVWHRQLKLAKEMGFMTDYKILTKWAASPEDWNIMVIEIFPNWASYDSFLENWNKVDERTVFTDEFREIMKTMEPSGTEFLGTVFAQEIFLKE